MRHLGKTYEKKEGAKVLNEIRIALTKDELDWVLVGLKQVHGNLARYTGIIGDDTVENARPVSDLYYNLKY